VQTEEVGGTWQPLRAGLPDRVFTYENSGNATATGSSASS